MLEDISSKEVLREESSHGKIWNSMHGGYFSSPDIAKPYIAEITETINLSQPDVVIDLGGGNGFILNELSKKSISDVDLIDLELSDEQLNSISNKKIIPKKGSIASFTREELNMKNEKLLYTCRSALHYSGLQGLKPLVDHIRNQMQPGEYFVHQTACFETDLDAEIINLLYDMMDTNKGYPTIKKMCDILENGGLKVMKVTKAPSLKLSSDSLMTRYNFNEKRMQEIIQDITSNYGKKSRGIFGTFPKGFNASLDYTIFSCKAI